MAVAIRQSTPVTKAPIQTSSGPVTASTGSCGAPVNGRRQIARMPSRLAPHTS